MKYRREVDGLRSIAVLPVIFYHAGITIFSGGYVGVDIFFVISGYLITTIIIAEKANSAFTIRNFYERRARRILPALFFVIIACIPFAWAWMTPHQLKDFSESLSAVSLFSSNILFWQESGYFSLAAELKPLLHTWSLAVEEQYYIFFPLFILATWRFGQKAIFTSLLLIGFTSLLLSQWGSANHPSANFYLLPTRLWELLIGSLISIYLLNKEANEPKNSERTFHIEQLFSCIGLALIVYSIFVFDDKTPFPSFYTLAPTIGTALIILFASRQTVVARLLSTKLPVGIGLISYSAYLWHQPLFAFARLRSISEPSHTLMVLLAFLSLALAFITWKYVEKPFRDKSKYTRSHIFYLSAMASVVVIGIGFAGHLNNGFASRTIATGDTYADKDFDDIIRANHGLSNMCEGRFKLQKDCRTSEQPEILVWGDSYAMHLVPGILSSKSDARIIQITKSICGPIIGLAPTNKMYTEKWSNECLEFNDSASQWIQDNTSLRYAVLSSTFTQYFSDDWNIVTSDGVFKPDASMLHEYFSSTLDFLISQGIQPVVFAPTPRIGKEKNIGQCLVKASIFGNDLDECNFSMNSYKNNYSDVIAFLEEIDQKYHVIWIEDFLCDSKICRAEIEGTFIYKDNGHLSHEGSALVGSKMDFYSLITSPDKPDSTPIKRLPLP
jgi:peptidoglycan/LPS O-acetylase OafA/YrhL